MERKALLAAVLLAAAISAGASAPDLTGMVEQSLIEISAGRPRRAIGSSAQSIKVMPFQCPDTYRQENIGALAAELVVRHLKGLKQIEVISGQQGNGRQASGNPAPGPSGQLVVTGEMMRAEADYHVRVVFSEAGSGREVLTRELDIPAERLHRMLDRHIRWKRRTWALQPYVQALYTERYLGDGYPPRTLYASRPGVSASVLVEPQRLDLNETAEFAGGFRLTFRKRLMLDLSYTAHGHSTSEGQYVAYMSELDDTTAAPARLLMYLNSSAVSASVCGTGVLLGDLRGYAGAGWERTTARQTVSSTCRLLAAGSGGTIETRGYFVAAEGPMPDGGDIVERASLPFLRAGIEWRPGRLGFNFLATYRLGRGEFRPVVIAVDQIFRAGSSDPETISHQTMEVTRYRLPRFSMGAAFTLSL